MNNLKNNQAFTLIEVLASITILGIVLTIFLSFFSNATLFSSKTEDKLTAINLAEKELYEVTNNLEEYCKSNPTDCQNPNTILEEYCKSNPTDCQNPNTILENKYSRTSIDVNNKLYDSTATTLTQDQNEIQLGLLPISVRISKDGKPLITLYGYTDLNPNN